MSSNLYLYCCPAYSASSSAHAPVSCPLEVQCPKMGALTPLSAPDLGHLGLPYHHHHQHHHHHRHHHHRHQWSFWHQEKTREIKDLWQATRAVLAPKMFVRQRAFISCVTHPRSMPENMPKFDFSMTERLCEKAFRRQKNDFSCILCHAPLVCCALNERPLPDAYFQGMCATFALIF